MVTTPSAESRRGHVIWPCVRHLPVLLELSTHAMGWVVVAFVITVAPTLA